MDIARAHRASEFDILRFDWRTLIGTKLNHCATIASITDIPIKILADPRRCKEEPLGTRISWAAARECTRAEDIVYCLLGLLDVNMSVLYGEGLERGFRRLQEELIRTTMDETIFAWTAESTNVRPFAPSPVNFSASVPYMPLPSSDEISTYSVVNGRLRTSRRLLYRKITTWEWRIEALGTAFQKIEYKFYFSIHAEYAGSWRWRYLKKNSGSEAALFKEVEAIGKVGLVVNSWDQRLKSVRFVDHKLWDLQALSELGAEWTNSSYELLIE